MIGHGGNIYLAARELGLPEKAIIDFSASINPLGVPKSVITEIRNAAKNLFNYPDPDATGLRMRLSEHHRIEPESIICGNGSTELIYVIARALNPERVLIPQPTFSEYERACRTASSKLKVQRLKLRKESNFNIESGRFIKAMKGCDAAFLCNPNNPTGRLIAKNAVLKITEAAKKTKCFLVIDEAFIDFCPENSVIDEVKKNPYLIVLRSMTKIYALSGLRIGYGVFPKRLMKELSFNKEPWTVNTLAQKAGITALTDKACVKRALALIKKEKKFLENSFKEKGIKFFHSDANFYLLKINNPTEIYQALKRMGILVRDCSNFRGLDNSYIRIAVKSHMDNMHLLKELARLCAQ